MHDAKDLLEFTPLAREVAHRMFPAGQVIRGRDRDDHAAEFAVVAANAREVFCERYGWCTPAERRYVRKTVWNAARNARRDAFRHRELFDSDAQLPEETDDFEARMEARDLVRRIEARFGLDSVEELARVYVSDGYAPDDRARARRVQRLRLSVRRFLENDCRNHMS